MRVSKRLARAIEAYFYHRSRARQNDGYVWDKQADLEAIDRATPSHVTFSAAAGTFWFTYVVHGGSVTLTTSERIWPRFERTFKKAKEA